MQLWLNGSQLHAFLASLLVKCTCKAVRLHHHYIDQFTSLSLSPHHYHSMGRPPCCDKLNVKRGLWTAEEDAKILACLSKHGIGNWSLVPKKAGLNRCGKSCRLRWTNYLRPDLKHNGFTPQEEDLIVDLHKAIGSRWSLIAKQLPGRTDNDVKNYWNTKLRKKLAKEGIDAVTHKPFSQILSDYGNISGLPNTRTRFGSLNKTSNNASMVISEPSSSVLTHELPNTRIVKKSMMEQIQDNLSTNNGSWDFQAHLFNEATSSSSSSSSTTVNQLSSPVQVITPSSPFSWSEFLLGDPFLSSDLQQQERKFTCGNEITFNGGTIGAATNKCPEASSSSMNSFVEAILDRDSEMCSEFPELLDESIEY